MELRTRPDNRREYASLSGLRRAHPDHSASKDMMRFIIGYACVFAAHVVAQFLMYGHARGLPDFLQNEGGIFLLRLLTALGAYTLVLRHSPLLAAKPRWRLAKLIVIAMLSSVVSLWLGGSWAFSTYGT